VQRNPMVVFKASDLRHILERESAL
jgi:hypothetical protein